MGYVPPSRSPERIMLYGDAGSHKTSAILDIAKRLPNANFYIVECDWTPSVDLMLEMMPKYAGMTNVQTLSVFPDDYDGQLEALKWATAQAQRGDWVAFDSFTHTWEASQTKYIELMFPDDDADAFYMRKRAENIDADKDGGNLDGRQDWPRIKSWHDKLYREISKTPAHFIATYEQTAMSVERVKGTREEKALFSREQFIPKGRKQFGHVYRTIAHLEVDPRTDVATYTTLKDRTRQAQQDHANGDWFRDFMVAVGGWHLDAQLQIPELADPPVNSPSDSTPQLTPTTAEGSA